MNRLEELIEKLCPDGVEYKKLGFLCEITKGIQFNKADMNDEGTYPVINGGINPSGYIEQYNQDENTITISQGGASAGFVNWLTVKFWAGAHCYIVKPSDTILNRYTYHFIKSQEYKLQECQYGAGIPALAKSTVEALKIPVPPLEVQSEIVRILDNFTELTAELTEKLTAELTARKKQYEYYRDELLTSDNSTHQYRLGEICDIYLGLTATPTYTDSGVKFISAQNTSGDYLDLENVKYISRQDFEKATSNAKPKKGDLLFTRVGSNLGHPVIVDTDEDLCIFVSLGFLRVKDKQTVLTPFLKYWMNTDMFWSQVRKNVHGAAKVNLNTGWLKDFEIAIPSLEEQQRIVDILDRFDKLCNDISEGLPAEIEARQKQYEYYRDKLLTFKEKAI